MKQENLLNNVCNVLNFNKEEFIDTAISNALSPYLNEYGEFNPKAGMFIDNFDKKNVPFPCLVLDEVTMCGKPYYKIFVQNKIMKVSKNNVVLARKEN